MALLQRAGDVEGDAVEQGGQQHQPGAERGRVSPTHRGPGHDDDADKAEQ
jgi:hypothetical protein